MKSKRDFKQSDKDGDQSLMFAPARDGTVAVDSGCPSSHSRKVYEDVLGMQYSCDLNQTNIVGNNNKFYKMQVHVAGGQYILYARYGRVGSKG